MRRYLSSAFSDRSFKSQEPLIADPGDRLVDKLEEAGRGTRGTNMVMWFNLVNFDIIGSLAFGKDFGGVEAGKEHFWVAIVTKSMVWVRSPIAFADFRQFLLSCKRSVHAISIGCKSMTENRKHQKYIMDLVQRHVSKPNGSTYLTRF